MTDKPYYLSIEVPGLPKTINQTAGYAWQMKFMEAKKWLTRIGDAIVINRQHRPPKPLTKAKVTFTRHSRGQMDYDNLVQSFKICQDCLVKLKIIENDSMKIIGAPEYKHNRDVPFRSSGFITITVEGI